ncbi:gliding motility lipoprotein GldB [Pedobacter polaris]|uniref:Gliding motility lipoprotein GldB n=1 Tax=Pedobacter polaris TaxID=2571273 RepID=A0A4V5P037_9SPHI|nr:gliding motility lipoprotein GldB [Pedobacter polaris]TKC12182.1 gliding motility lipoprotein GldB [Pedobacter polaris]
MNYNVKHLQIYLFFICIITIFSCKQDKRPDISNIKLAIKVQRFDQDLYNGKNKNLLQTDFLLNNKYGNFYNDFIHKMVGTPELKGTEVLSILYKDQAYTDLNKEVDSVYPNLTKVEKDLSESFKYIKHYYPNTKVPKFISYLSGFAYQVILADDYMGIGLDMFLGANSKFYPAIVQNVPMYASRRFTPDYIVPRINEVFAREELFLERDEDQNLLSKMIYNGKILYFLDQVLPENTADSVKIGYTSKQLEWCKNYEGNIWGLFLQNDLLYQSDLQKIQVFITDGPFTLGIGNKKESAPKLGFYVGWQIVKKYMSENPEITLQQLMAETDAQKILTKSKYKPKESQ